MFLKPFILIGELGLRKDLILNGVVILANILQTAMEKRKCLLIGILENSTSYRKNEKYLQHLTLTDLELEYEDYKENEIKGGKQ